MFKWAQVITSGNLVYKLQIMKVEPAE